MALNRLLIVLGIATGLVACDSADKAKATFESVSSSLTQSAIFDADGMLWLDSLQAPVAMIRDGESLLIVPTNLEGDQFYFNSLRPAGEDGANYSTLVTAERILPYFGDREKVLFDEAEACTELMGFLENGGDPKWVRALVYMTGAGDWYVQPNLEELKVSWARIAKEEIDKCVTRSQSPDLSLTLTFRNTSQNPEQEILPALIADDGSAMQYSFIRKLTDSEKANLVSKTKSFLEERKAVREKFQRLASEFSYEAQIESVGLAGVQPRQALILMDGNNRFRVAEDGE